MQLARSVPSSLRVALVTLAGFTCAACSTTLDMDAVGKSVTEGLQAQLGLAVASVTCPTQTVTAKAGESFECIATPKEGGRLVITVHQKDDKGNVDWKVSKTEGLLDLQLVESSVKQGLKEQAQIEANVTCGERWKGARPGGTFECQASTADGEKAVVDVTMTDTEGNITWKLRQS